MKWKSFYILFLVLLSLPLSTTYAVDPVFGEDWPIFEGTKTYTIPGVTLNELVTELKELENDLKVAKEDLAELKRCFEEYKNKTEIQKTLLKGTVLLSSTITGASLGYSIGGTDGIFWGLGGGVCSSLVLFFVID
jgi:hypothetical protein